MSRLTLALVGLLACALLVAATPLQMEQPPVLSEYSTVRLSELQYQSLFSSYMTAHAKKYAVDELFLRFSIFKANHAFIQQHNAKGLSYHLALNEFADLTAEEFAARNLDGQVDASMDFATPTLNAPHHKVSAIKADDNVDWRSKGAVSYVKNQASCGSCWSFAATGAVESATAIKTGRMTPLSEQQLIDCSSSYGNAGCNGGLAMSAFKYIMENGGVTNEESYPYKASQSQCKPFTPVSTVRDYVLLSGSEDEIVKAASLQPVAISVATGNNIWQFYAGGVVDDASCGTATNHAVLIVGYGFDDSVGKPFYIVKNSWGPKWGEGGYIRLVRNKNQCAVTRRPVYPLV